MFSFISPYLGNSAVLYAGAHLSNSARVIPVNYFAVDLGAKLSLGFSLSNSVGGEKYKLFFDDGENTHLSPSA